MSATKTTPLLDELEARDTQVMAARGRIREVDEQAQAARAEAAQAKEELTEAFASDDQAKADKLTRAKVKAEATAREPWDERRAGAQRAAERVQAERDAWVVASISGLIAEVEPSARAAAEAIRVKARELDQARRAWHAISQRVSSLLAVVPGVDGRSLPPVEHIDNAVRDLLRATVDMPAPLPMALQAPARVVPEHDVPAGVFLSDRNAA